MMKTKLALIKLIEADGYKLSPRKIYSRRNKGWNCWIVYNGSDSGNCYPLCCSKPMSECVKTGIFIVRELDEWRHQCYVMRKKDKEVLLDWRKEL